MPFSFTIPRKSSDPPFEVALLRKNGQAIDLTTYQSAKLVIAKARKTAEGDLDLEIDLDFGNRKKGEVEHQWTDAETDIEEDTYLAQVIGIKADGNSIVLPEEPFEFTVTEPVKYP